MAALLSLACASQQTIVVWEKPGAGPDEIAAAQRVCLAEVEALQTHGVNRTRFEAEATGTCFVACMRRHGFTWRTEKAPAGRGTGPDTPGAEPGEPVGDAESEARPGAPSSGMPTQAPDSSDASASGCSSTGTGFDGS